MAAQTKGPGGKQPTINDVAALAGVSKKTVSRVINRSEFLTEKTRKAVEQAIETLGFVPNPQARALAFRRNFLIALLHDNPNAQTVLNFQQGVLDAIKDSDLALLVRPVDRGSDRMLDDVRTFLEKQRPIGALLLPPISENDDLAALCEDLGVRYVRVGSAPLDDAKHCVSSNDREVVAEAVRALIALGHRRIGFVRGPIGFRSAAEREKGFLEALAETGLELPSAYNAPGNYRYTAGIEAGEALLSLAEPPTRHLLFERRNGRRRHERRACQAHRCPGRAVDHRFRRQPDRNAHLARAEHRALADPRNGDARRQDARPRLSAARQQDR